MRRGRPGARGEGRGTSGSGPGCGRRPPSPARCERGPDLTPQPAAPAQGMRPPAPPYQGGGHGRSGRRRAPAGGGNRGKGGDGVGGGTVRRPEPSARSGGASRSLQQRRPSQTPRSRRGQSSPEASPAPERAGPQRAGRWGGPGSGVTTDKSQRLLTLALPAA